MNLSLNYSLFCMLFIVFPMLSILYLITDNILSKEKYLEELILEKMGNSLNKIKDVRDNFTKEDNERYEMLLKLKRNYIGMTNKLIVQIAVIFMLIFPDINLSKKKIVENEKLNEHILSLEKEFILLVILGVLDKNLLCKKIFFWRYGEMATKIEVDCIVDSKNIAKDIQEIPIDSNRVFKIASKSMSFAY